MLDLPSATHHDQLPADDKSAERNRTKGRSCGAVDERAGLVRPTLDGSPLTAEHFQLRPGSDGFRTGQCHYAGLAVTYSRDLGPVIGDP